jgi:uncharacterized protein YqcC (DUF446 family)
MTTTVLVSFMISTMATSNWLYHIRIHAPCSLLKVRSMRPTTLTLNPEIRMQARQSMRDVALIRTGLCYRDVFRRYIPAESNEMSPI